MNENGYLRGQTDINTTVMSAIRMMMTPRTTISDIVHARFGRGLWDRNDRGMTPLLQAVQENDLDALYLLRIYMALTLKNDEFEQEMLVARDVDEHTILHLAAQTYNPSILQELLRINDMATWQLLHATNNTGLSPLHCYVVPACTSSMKLLLNKGAFINSKTNDGYTPLHIAAYLGRTSIVQFLLDNGADLYAKDNDGIDALGFAMQVGADDIVQILYAAEEAKANIQTEQAHDDDDDVDHQDPMTRMLEAMEPT